MPQPVATTPALARRTRHLPASPIRKLAPLATQAKARGLEVFGLNIGQPDLETPPEFFEAIARANIKTLAYAPSEGFPEYRQGLATYYSRFGIQVDPGQILVTNGGSEALQFVFQCCFDPGDEVVVPEPFYANYLSFATQYDVKLVPLPTHIRQDYRLPSPEAFEAVLSPRTKGILMCNPSNPTGQVMHRPELEQLAQLVRQHNLFWVADEVYKEFLYDGLSFSSVLNLPGLEAHVVVVDSVSKRWSACGARVGNLVTRNPELYAAALKLAQARLSPPTLGQLGATALLQLPDSYYDGVRAEYARRRDLTVQRLNAMPGVYCPPSQGAFYVMPELPVDDVEAFVVWMLTEFAHTNRTVMLAPGTGFYATPGQGRNQARLAYVLELPVLERALDALQAALATSPNRTA